MKKSELAFTLTLVPIDLLSLFAAASTAYYLRFHPYFIDIRPIIFDLKFEPYLKIIIPIILIWIFVFAITGLYTTKRISIASELTKIGLACSTSMALVFAISFFSRILFESRFIAIAAWLLSILFISVSRLFIRGLQRSLLKFDIGTKRIVIIGKNQTAQALIDEFNKKTRLGFRIVGQYKKFDKSIANKIKRLKKEDKIDEIILADPSVSKEIALEIITLTETEHLGFKYSADMFTAAVGKSVIHTYAGVPVIEVSKTPLDGWGAIYKRLFDITGALILIILSMPIQIIVAIALFIEQPGNILFSRTSDGKKTQRVGQGGKTFYYFKFRSMIKNAHKLRFDKEFIEKYGNEREGSPLFKLKNDPRITTVGKFIRKYSIDEIPEFYSVLIGNMSLVGPRPHLPEEVKTYKHTQKKVLTIKPGITGLSQISGRADLDFDDEVRLDTYYIEHWSPWLDFYILLKTPLIVLFRKGAY